MKNYVTCIPAIMLFSLTASCHAMESIAVETAEYLARNSTPEADAQWKLKLETRIAQMLKDSESLSGPEAAAVKLGFDYFFDLKAVFEAKRLTKKIKIDVCRMYRYFVDQGWEFPSRIRDDISKAKFKIWFLDTGEK